MGCGSVGRCLGKLLSAAGFSIRGVCCTSRESAARACRFIGTGTPLDPGEGEAVARSADWVIIATPDSVIAEAASTLVQGIGPKSVVLHLSGALSSELLEPCRRRGAAVGSMPPLQSFADPESALKIISGSIFAIEGDEAAVTAAYQIAEGIGGSPIRIETASKAIYHAAASAASNFLIPPLVLAMDLMGAAGLARDTALEALKPLILGTAANAASVGVPQALTGPIERGDCLVVEGHLEAIEKVSPLLKERYLVLARLTVEAAKRKGALSEDQAREMRAILGKGIH